MSAHSSSNHLSSTTQEFLDVLDITNNLVLLRDGTASMVMSASSVNFDLLSEEEQEAMIYTYAGILNSLSFPIQIVIRSQKKDISGYLGHLQETERGTHAPQKRAQIAQYREFVSTLVKERNILDKKFYLVISYQSSTLSSILPTSPFPFKKQKSTQESQINIPQLIEKAKTDLEPKRDHIISLLLNNSTLKNLFIFSTPSTIQDLLMVKLWRVQRRTQVQWFNRANSLRDITRTC